MKKMLFPLCSALLLWGLSAQASKNTVSLNGKDYGIDTLVYKHNIGPGTKYAFYNVPDRPLTIHVMEIDLTNPYVDIETCLSGDSAVATERPSSMYIRNDRPGHDMIGSTNGDFYQYVDPIEIGIPRSGQFRKNECVTNPVGRASFVLTPERVPYIDRVDFRGTLTKGETSTRIHAVNMQRLEWEDTKGDFLLLYTNSYGKYTHKTSGGTKAIIRPKSGQLFFSANKNIECVVETVSDNPGISPIPENAAVLYGVGASETYLKTLGAGDEVTVFLKTDLRSQPGLLTDFKEQMGGSNDIVLQGGQSDAGQSGAATGEHPRTGMGVSQDKKTVYMVVIDGRQTTSSGVSLQDFGEVFKVLGAWDAVNLDGGGSSCMYIRNEIKNSPSDGKERAVGNGVLVVSNAPEDNAIAKLEFSPRPYNVPLTARFRPVVYAFNQYGLLKDDDLEGVKLSCSPEIGVIKEDNVFVAVAHEAEGVITATYNGITATQPVKVVNSPLTLVHDKYLVDDNRSFEIQMEATVGITTDAVDPATVDWIVENPEICEVNNGIVKGLRNGTTTIKGTSSNFSGEVTVTVEIPTSEVMPVVEAVSATEWKLSQLGGTGISISGLDKGFALNYTGNGSGRGAYITAERTSRIWSLPEKIRIRINPGISSVTKLSLNISNALGANEPSWAICGTELPKEQESVIEASLSDIFDTSDIGIYPITINSIRLDMNKSEKGKEFEIQVPGFEAVYSAGSGIGSLPAANAARVYPNPVASGAAVTVESDGAADVELYTLGGVLMNRISIAGTATIATDNLSKGMYVVKVSDNDSVKIAKLIVK